MTIQELIRRKKELGYSNKKIAELSGVPLGTVMKIFSGATKTPRHDTLKALEKALAPDPDGPYTYTARPFGNTVHYFRESLPAYADKKDRLFTVDDYEALPDDRRTELIDGVFYDMAAPAPDHQLIIGEIFVQLRKCAKEKHAGCTVFLSPCDVQLDSDNYTMVQPDILVICDDAKRTAKRIVGAPDLAIEILSPSTRGHDGIRKLNKYKNAGVREYWMVDPELERVMVHVFENGTFSTYTFEDAVPVSISGGECTVDFKEIKEEL